MILGGTAEARALAAAAIARFGGELRVTTSLAGRTRSPAPHQGALRRGGFGGAAGLAQYLREAAVDLVIDATHPFALRISAAAAASCRAFAVPLLSVARPEWEQQAGDRWIEVADAAAAAARLPELGSRVFLTIGHAGLSAFAPLAETYFLVRLIEPPAGVLPLARYDLVSARGPFTLAQERHIMERHAIDVLVTKASGGSATAAKLAAARALAIPVLMLRRRQPVAAESVARIEDALSWIEHRLARNREIAT